MLPASKVDFTCLYLLTTQIEYGRILTEVREPLGIAGQPAEGRNMNEKSSDVRVVFASPIRLVVKALAVLVQDKRKYGEEITPADNAEYDAIKTAALTLNVWY